MFGVRGVCGLRWVTAVADGDMPSQQVLRTLSLMLVVAVCCECALCLHFRVSASVATQYSLH